MAIGDKIPVEAIKKALAENPVLKWAVIGLVAIFAVEFLAKEGIAVWKELATVQLEVNRKNMENCSRTYSMEESAIHCRQYRTEKEQEALEQYLGSWHGVTGQDNQKNMDKVGSDEKTGKIETWRGEHDLARQEWEVALLGFCGAVAWVMMSRNIDARAGEDRKQGAWRRLKVAGAALVISQGVPWVGAPLLRGVPMHLPDWLFWLAMGVMVLTMIFVAVQILVALWELIRGSRAHA